MPELTPTRLFLQDIDNLSSNRILHKKILKALSFLGTNPLHPGLNIERITNDPSAWSIRVDRQYRISLDPKAGNPDWDKGIILLRVLDHDDLYKTPR